MSPEKDAGRTKKKANDPAGNATVRAKEAVKKPAEKASARSKGRGRSIRAPEPDFPIVGIGASAGGLEACEKFFKNMPQDSGMAFVVISHLDPKHESIFTELVGKFTAMPVAQISDGMKLNPNHVYVAPPKYNVAVFHGSFQLIEPVDQYGSRMPINFFLSTLAQDRGSKAIGVILSGMGSDGTQGMREIKAQLGMAMVQAMDSAKYSSMPKSAIDTNLADYILPAEEIPEQLIRYVIHSKQRGPIEVTSRDGALSDSLKKVFVLLRAKTGHDFSFYKPTTISRRIERRMNVHQIENLSGYVSYLQRNPEEISALFHEMLIGVTGFFRDPEAFDALKKKGLLKLIGDLPNNATLRAWVPGCSTGEEAYSTAMLVTECMKELDKHLNVQIFATDIDDSSIDRARLGVYAENIVTQLSPERLQRYFKRTENRTYMVNKDTREMVVFAIQDVIKDPPFTKLDLLCCRNLLIYLNADLQKRILPLFHYSLKPGGILFLGTSESVGGFLDLFSAIDRKWKVYRRMESASPNHLYEFPIDASLTENQEGRGDKIKEIRIQKLAEKALLDFAPTSVITDHSGNIFYIHGRTGAYLEPAPGEARLNILEMAREGLQSELNLAMRKALKENKEVLLKKVEVKSNGGSQRIDMSVKVIQDSPSQKLVLVSFFENAPAAAKGRGKELSSPARTGKNKQVEAVKEELRYTKENLQTTIEEMETSNEELKSTNEELQSTNEELQSANEELETSKEEQQSLNEELVTVNSELQGKIEELSRTNSDMRNLLDSTEVPTLFLDNDLNVTRFTSSARKIFKLIQSDVGRPISDIVPNLNYSDLDREAREVLGDLQLKEREVETKDGRWFLMRMMPYKTMDRMVEGLVITFLDIHDLKMAAKK